MIVTEACHSCMQSTLKTHQSSWQQADGCRNLARMCDVQACCKHLPSDFVCMELSLLQLTLGGRPRCFTGFSDLDISSSEEVYWINCKRSDVAWPATCNYSNNKFANFAPFHSKDVWSQKARKSKSEPKTGRMSRPHRSPEDLDAPHDHMHPEVTARMCQTL